MLRRLPLAGKKKQFSSVNWLWRRRWSERPEEGHFPLLPSPHRRFQVLIEKESESRKASSALKPSKFVERWTRVARITRKNRLTLYLPL